MRVKCFIAILVLMAVGLLPAPAQAGGVVTVCDEAHLLAALSGGGTVTFACSGTITLTNSIGFTADTTIDGDGQDVTISGGNTVRVFGVSMGQTAALNKLTIADGSVADFEYGGAIQNWGSLYVSNSTLTGNNAYNGGAIANFGALTVTNSTFTGNSATGSGGAIIRVIGTVTVNTSTFAGNQATYNGGGIGSYSSLSGSLVVGNSTFVDNRAESGGGLHNLGTTTISNSTFSGNRAAIGGGTFGVATMKNTIVAYSPAGGNCSGAITDGDGNLSFPDTTCAGINADPLLGPLQDNGGPTWTMALDEGSAAIDAADDAICAAPPVNNLDQRGVTRPQGTHCDIGAVEQILEPAAVSLSTVSAESASGAIPPTIVFGLLLVALASIGAVRHVRQMRCD